MLFLGLDLGQRRDHTALAMVDETAGGLDVRHLERVRLGTSYVEITEWVERTVKRIPQGTPATLVVDATGVGGAVLNMPRPVRAICRVEAITITGGERVIASGTGWHVPKRELVAVVQGRCKKGELRIARGLREARTLADELGRMRANVSKAGHDSYEAAAGAHDDLVLAVAMACWRAKRGQGQSKWGTRVLLGF